MKVLLITDQFLHINNEGVFGPANFCDNVRRLSIMGELSVCVQNCEDTTKMINVFNQNIEDILPRDRVTFIKKSFIWPRYKTISKMKSAIANADLVIGYVPALNAEVAERLAHNAGKKYFALMVACPWDGLWNQDWKRKIAAPYRFLLNRRVLKRADYALYVTNKFLQRRYPTYGQSIGLSDVVLNKSDESVLERRIEKIESMTSGPVKIATTAMLNIPYKGQRFVIRALRKLKDMGYTNYHYYLIGGGSENKLKNLAHKLGVADQVTFVGRLTHEQVFMLLDDIDIYIHPSLQEGLPRSVVEAMSRGLPCIGANTAAIPKLIDADFIVRRKSVDDIVSKLLKFDKQTLKNQAIRNFKEALKFDCTLLDKRRNEFYLNITKDFE